ncbi:carboxylate--amine ligase [Hephaestia mangrovi]|uniref:carboxylate--amine ligase n=1 Tax=Hephaestia mangrovi TaxID=2873268 RepID=UPI001CA70FD8|nr:carboxylate--amine ligase [Hephaestia mangrovi]MBY8827346.1 carboxylate--amine ligase [Hephaestia mangrovi]
MSSLPPAIVLGVDSPIGLTVMRELGEQGVPVHAIGSRRSIGRASRYCRGFTERPAGPIGDWLPDVIAETQARALLAVSENDLLQLAVLPAEIDGCAILTPRAAPLGIVLDKAETLRRAAAIGIDTPPTWQPMPEDDLAARARSLAYPVVAKWADPPAVTSLLDQAGLDFIKAEFLHDADALLAMMRRYRALGQWPLVQSYCPGVGIGQMIFMDRGEAVLRFQHRRLREWPPEGGTSTFCAAEPLDRHADQMERSIALLQSIGWQGPAMVEYRHDERTGAYWLMEVNGRFWGSLPLAWHCGARFAWEAYRRAVLGDDQPAPAPRAGLRARYMVPDTRRLARVLFGRAAIVDPMFAVTPWRDLLGYVGGMLDPRTCYYVATLRDPGPLCRDALSIARKALRRR